jgi:WD40 repeat protein
MARDDEIIPAMIDGDDLLVLLDRLRADGFAIGVREYITAQEIAAAFLKEDSPDPTRLRNWLAPVLCTSADQQRLFYQRFAAWWLEAAPQPVEEAPPPVLETELDEDVRQIRPWKWRALTALALLLAVPAIVLVIHFLEPGTDPTDDPVIGGGEVPPLEVVCKPTTAKPRTSIGGERPPPARQVRVPNLKGLALPDARRELASARLTAGRVIENVNESIDKGQVLRTNPQRGAGVDECSAVNLYVSTGSLKAELSIGGAVVDVQEQPVEGAAIAVTRLLASISDTNGVIGWSRDDGAVRLLNLGAPGSEPVVFPGHDEAVFSVAFSPDGQLLASGSLGGTVRLWDIDAPDADTVVFSGSEGATFSASFSPDGRLLAWGSFDGTVRLWNVDAPNAAPVVLSGHSDAVFAVAFSPDGQSVASGSLDGTVRLWNLEAPGAAPVVYAGPTEVSAVAFSPDSQSLASGSHDGTIRLWRLDAPDAAPLVFPGHTESVSSVAFSPDGQTLASGSHDGTLRLWRIDAPTAVPTIFVGHDQWVILVAFSPDGQLLAAGNLLGTIRVWNFGRDIPRSGDDGTFSLSIDTPADAFLNASLDGFLAPLPFKVPQDPGELSVQVELAPVSEGWIRGLTVHRPEIQAGLFAVPLILTFGWWRWKRYRRRLILERREIRGARSLAAVKIPEPPHALFRDPTSVRARIEARRRLRFEGGDLDAEATVDETIRRLGWFSPVYRSRLVLPAYLALIDRSSFRDQQARLIDEFLDRLVEGGVHVDRYYFDRDPRICAAAVDDRINQRSLRELAARYSDSILMLCSDGAGLTDPLTGRLDRWTELLQAWTSRSLMTPVPPYHWSSRELEIAGAGFSAWPATSAGMLTFTGQMQNPEAQVVIPTEWQPSFPEIIAAHPARWLERNEPDPDDVDRALRQVRGYLGRDSYRWLCALAVYPELDWYLTLYLGLELKRGDGTPVLNEEALLNVVRLPWLRHGRIPDWLRSCLVAALSREDEQAVRGFLWNLLRARLEAPDSRFRLDIARPQTERIDRNWKRFFTDLLRTEPDDSPLHDMVFVSFLLDKRPQRLQLLAPQN